MAEYIVQTKTGKMSPIYVCTSHFESLDYPEKLVTNNENQLADTFGVLLKDEPNCVVLGDYNFDGNNNYNTNIK